MKPIAVMCTCLMLAGSVLLAQSGFTQGDGVPVAFEPQGPHQVPRVLAFAQAQRARHGAGALGTRSRRRKAAPQLQNGPEQVLYTFLGGNDGATPAGGLIFDSSGNLYGTTTQGGGTGCGSEFNGCGTAFELSPNGNGGWTETILYTFQGGSDGGVPSSGLIFDQVGNLYGTTAFGGAEDGGTVFELSPNPNGGWTETVLYSFADKTQPQGLIFDQKGNLYGTALAEEGGCGKFDDCGEVFELSPNGSGGWTETTVYAFQNSSNLWGPNPEIIFDRVGNIYGTTFQSGIPAYGQVFELSPNGSGGWTATVLHNFQGVSDGEFPEGGLIFDQAGNLYGTTFAGGTLDLGTVFELRPNGSGGWTETILHTFLGGSDGYNPSGELIFDEKGNLYGTTTLGGGNGCPPESLGCGTVFELSPYGGGGWTDTILYAFQGGSDGWSPGFWLIFDKTGNLYGTTYWGGDTVCKPTYGCGVAFQVSREPFAAFSPASLNFDKQTVGIGSSPQLATFTNSGNLPLTITSIEITGANNADFSQTNNCPSSLSQNSSCKISVTFTPTAIGNRSAAVSVTDNAPGSPQSIPLTGVGTPAAVTPSPSSLTFSPQIIGTTSKPQIVRLSSSSAISITSIVASAEFGQTNDCGNGLPAGGSCQITVTFAPAASGPQNGTLTIADSGADSPQTVPLSGTGQAFSLAAGSQASMTVTPGQAANYPVVVVPMGGFSQTVALSCSGMPAQSTCTVTPNSVTLDGTHAATVNVAALTMAASAGLTQPAGGPGGNSPFALWVALAGVLSLALLMKLGQCRRERPSRLLGTLALLCLLSFGIAMSACGGGGTTGGGGTPTGTYTLTVTGTFTSGSVVVKHAVPLTLIVQ